METGASKASNTICLNTAGQSIDVNKWENDNATDPHCEKVDLGGDVSQCINVMFVCSEWGSKKGGLSTFNRQLAVNLAKTSNDRINVHCYVCESGEEERQDASRQGVNLITARRPPGSSDPLECLKFPPPELPHPDIVVGHGTGSRGVQFEQVNKKTSLSKCNHAFRFPGKTSSAMHSCKFVTVHCFKIDTIVLYSIVSLRAPLF